VNSPITKGPWLEDGLLTYWACGDWGYRPGLALNGKGLFVPPAAATPGAKVIEPFYF